MAFLAHWKIDEAPLANATTAIDSIAGGSGSHSGAYAFTGTGYYGRLDACGVGGRHLRLVNTASDGGHITSIGNPGDFRLAGTFTGMFWFHKDHYYFDHTRTVFNCTGINDSSADENDWWDINCFAGRTIQVRWETAPGVRVTVGSALNILPKNGWCHIAVVRYEVVTGMWGIKFYVNGVLADTQDNSGSGWSPPVGGVNALPYIGRTGATTHIGYETWIDSVRFYDDAQSDSQILAVYNDEVSAIFGTQIGETGPNNTGLNAGFSTI